jgi:hypothetical protein
VLDGILTRLVFSFWRDRAGGPTPAGPRGLVSATVRYVWTRVDCSWTCHRRRTPCLHSLRVPTCRWGVIRRVLPRVDVRGARAGLFRLFALHCFFFSSSDSFLLLLIRNRDPHTAPHNKGAIVDFLTVEAQFPAGTDRPSSECRRGQEHRQPTVASPGDHPFTRVNTACVPNPHTRFPKNLRDPPGMPEFPDYRR